VEEGAYRLYACNPQTPSQFPQVELYVSLGIRNRGKRRLQISFETTISRYFWYTVFECGLLMKLSVMYVSYLRSSDQEIDCAGALISFGYLIDFLV